jgi:hypothetical protein
MAGIGVPVVGPELDVGRDGLFAERVLQHGRLLKRAQRVEHVERQLLCAFGLVALGIHVDVEPLAGIAAVAHAVESGGKNGGRQQIWIGGAVGEPQLEAAGSRNADHVRAIITGKADGVGRPGCA